MSHTISLSLALLVLTAPLRSVGAQCTECAPGTRVRITGAVEIVAQRHTRAGVTAVGALVDQTGDTIRLRVPGGDSIRVFVRGPETAVARALPRAASDPVLVGDAFRLDGRVRTVRRVAGDEVTFGDGPDSTYPLQALYASASATERLVHRPARPLYYVAGTTLGIAGAGAVLAAYHRELHEDPWESLLKGPPMLILAILGAGFSVQTGVALGAMLGREKEEWRSLAPGDRPTRSVDSPTLSLAPGIDGSVTLNVRLPR